MAKEKWILPDGIGPPCDYAQRKPGVYVIIVYDRDREYNRTQRVAYIGKSINLYNRIKNHPVYRQLWANDLTAGFKFKHCDNVDEMEKKLIARLKPIFNIQLNGKKIDRYR